MVPAYDEVSVASALAVPEVLYRLISASAIEHTLPTGEQNQPRMSSTTLQVGRIVLRSSTRQKQLSSCPLPRKRQQSSKAAPDRPCKPPQKPAEEPLTSKTIPPPDTVALLPLWWQRLGPLTQAFSAYGRAQRKRPYVSQLCSSVVIYLCGDLSAQYIGGEDYDPLRTLRNMTIGAISSIPSYNWYVVILMPVETGDACADDADWADRFMVLGRSFNFPFSKTLSLTTKVVVNQVVFAPVFNSYFFGMQALLSGHAPRDAWEHVKRTVPPSLVNSCKLWPAVTAFSFTFVAPQYRALFAGWN